MLILQIIIAHLRIVFRKALSGSTRMFDSGRGCVSLLRAADTKSRFADRYSRTSVMKSFGMMVFCSSDSFS